LDRDSNFKLKRVLFLKRPLSFIIKLISTCYSIYKKKNNLNLILIFFILISPKGVSTIISLSIIVLFLLFCVLSNRYRRKKKLINAADFENQNRNQTNNFRSASLSTSLSNHSNRSDIGVVDENSVKKYSTLSKNDLQKSSPNFEFNVIPAHFFFFLAKGYTKRMLNFFYS
jgi:hypothetical protein